MQEFTKQFLIKVSQDMDERIEKKYSQYLKSGLHITKSEFIRCLLNEALIEKIDNNQLTYDEICLLGSFVRDSYAKTQNYSIWKYPFSGWEHVFSSLANKNLII